MDEPMEENIADSNQSEPPDDKKKQNAPILRPGSMGKVPEHRTSPEACVKQQQQHALLRKQIADCMYNNREVLWF